MTKVLIAYATADGSTEEVAFTLAGRLEAMGLTAHALPVASDPDPRSYEAVIVGSAIHNGKLLPEAVEYVRTWADDLRKRDTWLFTLGMGPALHGPIGGWFKRMIPPPIAAVRDELGAREYHPFAGVFGRPTERKLRVITRLLGLQYGDRRNWDEIHAWADSVGESVLHASINH